MWCEGFLDKKCEWFGGWADLGPIDHTHVLLTVRLHLVLWVSWRGGKLKTRVARVGQLQEVLLGNVLGIYREVFGEMEKRPGLKKCCKGGR